MTMNKYGHEGASVRRVRQPPTLRTNWVPKEWVTKTARYGAWNHKIVYGSQRIKPEHEVDFEALCGLMELEPKKFYQKTADAYEVRTFMVNYDA